MLFQAYRTLNREGEDLGGITDPGQSNVEDYWAYYEEQRNELHNP